VTTRVERLQKQAATSDGVIGLSGGLPATELIPDEDLARGFRAAVRDPDRSWQYGWCEGDAALRRWVAGELRRRGADVEADDVIITAGAQQALALASAELFIPGTRIACGATSYAAALQLFRLRDAEPVAHDSRACPADLAYLMPGVATPTGVDGVPDPGRALDGQRALIVDEAYSALRFDGRVAPPLCARARHRIWHVGTVSKILCPGLRVGWLVPPRARTDAVRARKQAADLQTGSLAQAVLARALERLDLEAHLARLRAAYARRAAILVEALRRHAPYWTFAEPEGGFAVFVETPGHGDDTELLATAVAEGVSFDPGHLFRTHPEADDVLRFRLCFSSAPEADLEEGVRRLAAVWDRVARQAQASLSLRLGSGTRR
jgi:2-aminoadipate transaminase